MTSRKIADKPTIYAAILSGGHGSRFKSELPKQFVKLAGQTIIEHTISTFDENPDIDEIIIVSSKSFLYLIEEMIEHNEYNKNVKIILGGQSRMESCLAAVNSITNDDDILIIHDGVRPLVSQKTISDCVNEAIIHKASGVVNPCTDAVFETNDNQFISTIFEREKLRLGISPQAFNLGLVRTGLKIAKERGHNHFLDYCGMIKEYDLAKISLVNGNTDNIKITYPEDLFIAETLLFMSTTGAFSVELDDLKDKNIVLFGGSRGVGETIMKKAEHYGANVFSYSRKNGFDIAEPQSVNDALEETFKQTGKIDYIICTTTISETGKLTDRSIESLKREVDVNYFGTIHALKYGTPYLIKTQGAFVLFASNSFVKGLALHASHSSINAAIVNLIQAEAEELSDDNVRINAINPGRRELQTLIKNIEEDNCGEPTVSNDKIAEETLRVLLSSHTGQVINIT